MLPNAPDVVAWSAAGMLRREVTPGFRVDLHHKELGIVLDTAREAGVVIPLDAVVAQLLAAVRAHGDGGLDHTAQLGGIERLRPERMNLGLERSQRD